MKVFNKTHLSILVACVFGVSGIPSTNASTLSESLGYEPSQLMGINFAEYAKRYETLQKAAHLETSASADIVKYLEAGITLSDIACDEWFAGLGRRDQNVNWFRSLFNTVGNLVLGISAINGAATASIARGNLGLAASNSAADNYKAVFIYGVTGPLHKKVSEKRKELIGTFSPDSKLNYDIAVRALLDYHNMCSPEGIQQVARDLDAAVVYKFDTSAKSLAETKLAADNFGTIEKIQKSLGLGLKLDDAYRLYVLAALSLDQTTGLGKKFRAEINEIWEAYAKLNADQKEAVVKLLQSLAFANDFGVRYANDSKPASTAPVAAVPGAATALIRNFEGFRFTQEGPMVSTVRPASNARAIRLVPANGSNY